MVFFNQLFATSYVRLSVGPARLANLIADFIHWQHLHIFDVIDWRTHFYKNKFNLSKRDQSGVSQAHVFQRRKHGLTISH